jgi:hypothetical protein
VEAAALGITGRASITLDEKANNAYSKMEARVSGSFPPPEDMSLEGLTTYVSSFKSNTEDMTSSDGFPGNHLQYVLTPISALFTKEDQLAYELSGEMMGSLRTTLKKVVVLR